MPRRSKEAKEIVAKVINHIIANPAQWTSKDYHCGDQSCFIGRADRILCEADRQRSGLSAPKWNFTLHISEPTLSRRLDITSDEAAWIVRNQRTIHDHYAFAITHVTDGPTLLVGELPHPDFAATLERVAKTPLSELAPITL